MTIRPAIALLLLLLFLLAIGRLARLDSGGPAHSFVELPGREPATMYLPGPGNPFFTVFPPPPAQCPAPVVLIHGFMSDRQMMSVLARRITENGYAVLTLDVQGHGENRNPIVGGPAMGDTLNRDVKQTVDYPVPLGDRP